MLEGIEWEQLLADLREMGFDNDAMNLTTLTKADGCIKGAIKALMALERAGS